MRNKKKLKIKIKTIKRLSYLFVPLFSLLRLECEYDSYDVGVWAFTLSYGFIGKRWLVPLNLKRGFYIKLWKLCFGSVFLCLEKDWLAFSIIKGKSLPNKIGCPSLALFCLLGSWSCLTLCSQS